jgi:hypothetical protein
VSTIKKRKSATSKKTKVSATSKRKLISTIKSTLIGKIEKANERNKAQRVKPYYLKDEDGKDLASVQNLLIAISTALVSAKKASVMSGREWYTLNKKECVVLDVSTIVTHKTDKLFKRADLAFDARLKSLAKIAKEIDGIGYFRYLQNGSALITPTNEDSYKVVLFRK